MHQLSADTRTKLADTALRLFQSALGDWEEMFGFKASVDRPIVRQLRSSDAMFKRIIGEDVLVSTRAEGPASDWVMFVLPQDFMGMAIATAMMLPPSDEPGMDGSNEQHVETAQELVNLFCGSATRALDSVRNQLRISQSVEHLRVAVAPDPPEIENGCAVICVNLDVEVEGRSGRAWCLLPQTVAAVL